MIRIRLALAVGLLLLVQTPATAQDQSQPHSETYLAGVVQTPTENIPPVQVIARYPLPLMSGGVNDFSGLHTRDGVNILLVSDAGFIVSARLQRNYSQAITGIELRQVAVLNDGQGQPLGTSRRHAEDITVGRDGSLYIAFAQYNRVVRYHQFGGQAETLPSHEDFDRLRSGQGLESLAMAPDGILHAIPEAAARATYGIPSYRWVNGAVDASFRLPTEGNFRPVAADFGPDGLLYVLEHASDGGGLRIQVRRARVNGRAISTPQVVMRSSPGQFGNLEGLSVFRDWNGRIRLLMVSDDNHGTGSSELIDVALNR